MFTCSNKGNVAIHTLLLSLEERYLENENWLQDTRYHQANVAAVKVHTVPTWTSKPNPFIDGCREEARKLVCTWNKLVRRPLPSGGLDKFRWFDEDYPKNADVNEYVQEHPLQFRDELFGDPENWRAVWEPLLRRPLFGERMRTAKTTNWARYSGKSSNNGPSIILVPNEDVIPATEEVACASSVLDNAYEVPKRKGKKRGRPAQTPVPRPDSDEDDSDTGCSYYFDVYKCCDKVRFAKFWKLVGKF